MENIYIQLIDSKGKSTFHNIPLQSTLTVGKQEGCDIKLSGKDILAVHALIESYDVDSIYIRAINPKAKVLVNGKSIDRARLNFSDTITIGSAEFQIKKVEVHEGFPKIKPEEDKDEDITELEKTLEELTPQATPPIKGAKGFETPLSEEELDKSLSIPEYKETRPETEEVTGTWAKVPIEQRETTQARRVVRASQSLRIKCFWYDVLLSDNLYPLTIPVTIGPGKRNTYTIPPNGLPKRYPLFVFEDFKPYLIVNDKFDGFIDIRGKELPLKTAREKLKVSDYRHSSSKLKLSFTDSGVIKHEFMKFVFEFVETPEPALRDKLFAKMDKTYKRALTIISILAFILLLAILIIPPPKEIMAERKEIKIIPGSYLKPVQPPAPTPKPLIARAGGQQGKEGEGARAAGEEGRRGKSTPGAKGQPSQIDLIREQGIGALMVFRTSKAMKDIGGGGGGGELDRAATKLRGGLPGETQIREGKGLRGTGTGGGGKLYGVAGGLGEKGKGLGRYGTGKADFGSKGEAQVTTSLLSDDAVITGQMDPAIIERLIRQNLPYLKWCYEKELNQNPDLEGKIVVDFIIGVDGYVTSSRTKTSSMNSPIVESCITRKIKTIKFPSPGAGIVQVFYPFLFHVAGGF